MALCLLVSPAVADRLIVLEKSDNQAVLVDPESLQVRARIPTGQAPHEVAVSPDGRSAYVSNYGIAAVFRPGERRRQQPGHTLTVIDLERRAVRDSFDLGTHTQPHGICVSHDGSRLWVTCEGARSVLELDAMSGEIRRDFATDQEGSQMLVPTPDERKLYVANVGSGTVTVIDLATGRMRSRVTGAGAEGIDVRPDGREVWVTNRSDNTISVVEVGTDSVVATLASGGQMPIRVRFTPDGRAALVANARSNSVTVFDVARRRRLGAIRVGAAPVGIQITPNGSQAFVACANDNRVVLIDLKTREVVKEFATGNEPAGMAWVRTVP